MRASFHVGRRAQPWLGPHIHIRHLDRLACQATVRIAASFAAKSFRDIPLGQA